MATETDSGLTCDECGGTPTACICEALESALSDVPDPPPTPYGADWGRWLRTVVIASNVEGE